MVEFLSHRPLIIGEVLFDRFPDGEMVLGGAPFNVAWNLHHLGARPYLLTAVGDDENGREVQRRMKTISLDTTGLQIDPNHPTAIVALSFSDGEPSYDILVDCAYDHITLPEDLTPFMTSPLLYHGSLAWRSLKTRTTIQRMKQQLSLPTFIDINIRKPWFDLSWLPELLEGAIGLKMNVDELAEITRLPCRGREEIEAASHYLRQLYPKMDHWITSGSEGAYLIDQGGNVLFAKAPKPSHFVDSVGAGDGFAAVIIHGMMLAWERRRILQEAVDFAATICSIKGALTVGKR